MPDQALDQVDRPRLDDELVVVGGVALRHQPPVRPLVEALAVLEADRERLHRPVELRRHDPDHGARVDPAAEEGAERHVGDQPPRDRVLEPRADLAGRLAQREVEVLGPVDPRDRRLPVALDDRLAPRLEAEHVPGRQAAHALEEGARCRHVAEVQVGGDRLGVQAPRHRGIGEQGLDLAPEHEPPARAPVVERLLAHPVAAEDEPPPALVPDGEGEHAVEAPGEIDRRELLGEMGDHLGVAARAQLVAALQQLLAQLAEVVDLAVQDHGDRAVLVGDRRVAGDQVDDREAILRDHRLASGEAPAGVGPAMLQGCELGVDDGAKIARLRRDDPADAAHQAAASCCEAAVIARQVYPRIGLTDHTARACRSAARAVRGLLRSGRAAGRASRDSLPTVRIFAHDPFQSSKR